MIIYVNNFQEAEKYPVLFGTAEWFMDNNRDIFYVKYVDQTGKATINTYEFHQIENEKTLSSADLITREDFAKQQLQLDNLSGKLDNLLTALAAQQTSTKTSKPSKSEEGK